MAGAMVDFAETLLFSAIMGLSIFVSLPIVVKMRTTNLANRLLLATAIGILIFLLGDVWGDASMIMFNGSLYGYGSSSYYDGIFMAALAVGFLGLYYSEHRRRSGLSASQTSLIIALGIGFQNLTEGLVFGALAVTIGLSGAALVVLVGFIMQNITEGFPIASPFLGEKDRSLLQMSAFFFIGGLPTILGGGLGFFYSSSAFTVLFDGLAIGAILYAVLPMFKTMFRDSDHAAQRVTYLGIFIGFLVGFLVNLV
jgi:ZIP family zinc transporter